MSDAPEKTVVVYSGGLDSTTLLYHLRHAGHEVKALTVQYGQRHDRELDAARQICRSLDIEQETIDLSGLAPIFGSNALTKHVLPIPEGQYAAENLQVTTVPNRNMIFLSLAIGWASSLRFTGVAFGAHAGSHVNYPDCRPEFANAMQQAAATCHWERLSVHCPFITWQKADIVRRGHELKVPFERTWSCYEGGEHPCGKCGTCVDRRNAFTATGIEDPLRYPA